MCSALPPSVIAARAQLAATDAATTTSRQVYVRGRDGARINFDRAMPVLRTPRDQRRARLAWGAKR